MKVYTLILLSYLFTLSSFAKVFDCTLNTKHSAGVVKDAIFQFTYDSEKDNSKSLQFKDYRFLIWASEGSLMLKLMGGEFAKALSIQFSLDQSQARFHYGNDFDFNCESDSESSAAADSLNDLSALKEKVKISILSDLTFPYHQPEEVDLMRTLFFQEKKVFDESAKLVPKLPWCSLRVQLSRNENTVIEKGELFSPQGLETHQNNSYFTTYSYSFVDFSSGKKMGATRLYNPFMLNCNLLRGMSFSAENLESIVGNYLKISK